MTCDALQVIIDKLKIWSDEWQLSMSVRKCAAICIGHHVNGLADHNYTMVTNSIPLRDHVVDLGVTVDSTLRYSVHIDQLVAKAKSCTGLLFWCFVTRDMNVLRKAFITYIWPMLKYASSIWSPTQVGLIDRIESVVSLYYRNSHIVKSLLH